VNIGPRKALVRRVLAISAVLALAAPAASTAGTSVPRIHGWRPILDFRPHDRHVAGPAVTAGTASVTRFTSTVSEGGTTFRYTMVGKNPFVTQAAPSTTIKTFLIPLRIVLPNNDTFDPTAAGSCDPAASAVTRTMQSPIVVSKAYSLGGTALGTGQYTDIFRRAEFFSQTGPTAINPGYHVKLDVVKLARQTVHVPAGAAAEFAHATACGEKTGAVEINWFDNYLAGTLLPSLGSQGVTVKTFPLIEVRDVVLYDTVTTNCCIFGYHAMTQTVAGKQTYGFGDYESSGRVAGFPDIAPLSHEVAEWEDDPFTHNPTKPWGNVGQVNGCQMNLEVGDPLTGTTMAVTTTGPNAHTYHPQELAFFSWFYHSSPSLGVNGLYSNNGTFTTAAAPCS